MAETGLPVTLDELRAYCQYYDVINLSDGTPVGLVGYDLRPREKYGVVFCWKILYIVKEHRRNFLGVLHTVFDAVQSKGIKRYEMVCDYKISKIIRKRFNNHPKSFVHLGEVDYMIRRLTEK